MAFNLAKSVCLPKDMEHHYKQLNTELKSVRSSTKSMILVSSFYLLSNFSQLSVRLIVTSPLQAIQKNQVTHRRIMELRHHTREAMAEAE